MNKLIEEANKAKINKEQAKRMDFKAESLSYFKKYFGEGFLSEVTEYEDNGYYGFNINGTSYSLGLGYFSTSKGFYLRDAENVATHMITDLASLGYAINELKVKANNLK